MPDCECLEDCPYFESNIMKEIDIMAKIRQQEYCKGDYTACARYMVFKALGKGKIPKDLLPFQVDEAKKLIEENKR